MEIVATSSGPKQIIIRLNEYKEDLCSGKMPETTFYVDPDLNKCSTHSAEPCREVTARFENEYDIYYANTQDDNKVTITRMDEKKQTISGEFNFQLYDNKSNDLGARLKNGKFNNIPYTIKNVTYY